MSHYSAYYNAQIGGGGGVKQVFAGSRYQRGHGGIGSFLSGLFRSVLPYIKSGAKAVGREAVNAGFNVLDDVITGTNFKQAVKNNARQSGVNLRNKATRKITEMMSGGGYKRRGVKRKRQSKTKRAGARTIKKTRRKASSSSAKRSTRKKRKTTTTTRKNKKQRTVYDIFNQ